MTFPSAAEQRVDARANAAFKILDLNGCLDLDDLLIAVVDPAGVAGVYLRRARAALEIGTLLIRKNDRVGERSDSSRRPLSQLAKAAAADLGRDIQVTVAAKLLDGIRDDGQGFVVAAGVRESRKCGCSTEAESTRKVAENFET